MAGNRWRVVAVPLTLGLAGLLFGVTASLAHGTDLRAQERTDLAELVKTQADEVQRLTDSVATLRAQVEAATAQVSAGDSVAAETLRKVAALQATAGLTEVRGPAVSVALDDAPPQPDTGVGEGPSPDDLVVHQGDVQAVVNALWQGGAEAMQIMDQRIVSTSAVRCVGNTLVLQGRVYSPPFVITAIGPVHDMVRALDASEQVTIYREYVAAYGLGYEVTEYDEQVLPPFGGSTALQHATVVRS